MNVKRNGPATPETAPAMPLEEAIDAFRDSAARLVGALRAFSRDTAGAFANTSRPPGDARGRLEKLESETHDAVKRTVEEGSRALMKKLVGEK